MDVSETRNRLVFAPAGTIGKPTTLIITTQVQTVDQRGDPQGHRGHCPDGAAQEEGPEAIGPQCGPILGKPAGDSRTFGVGHRRVPFHRLFPSDRPQMRPLFAVAQASARMGRSCLFQHNVPGSPA